ncbi:thioesterase family protein [Nocardia sp. CA2R105]|uniref:acyl-CoA thioesterase n=1 Tax=Nocardia coffeae TaxID=2873381 RepID=UPI001CA7181B|nr:thioesterase family protein [Nocardia coffeae]MBY8862950.1 thioesterase family protein [Nocardia coffeae]
MSQNEPWAETLTTGPSRHEGHLDNIEIAQLLYDAWQSYFTRGLGYNSDQLFADDSSARPIVRSISVRYDGEVFPGLEVAIEIRAIGRRSKGFTLEQTLRRIDDGRVLAVGTVVLVTINTQTFTPVAVPESLWSAIEELEGRAIPIDA